MTNPLIGLRMKALRHAKKLTQDDLAGYLGIADRQTISQIENGERTAKGHELSTLIERFRLDAGYFTDPFRLVGEGEFSWRQQNCSPAALGVYHARASQWLAAYRALAEEEDRLGPREARTLRLWRSSSFELASMEGERFTSDYNMGPVPARTLPNVMENEFGILVLMVDMDQGMSGAACRLPEMDAVLVNRQESVGRRNFDLAHEFFHILTWDKMPPKPVEDALESGGTRVEQLANIFASALLMPRRLLEVYGDWRKLGNEERRARMLQVANHFLVSVSALHWRLVGLGFINGGSPMIEAASGPDEGDDGLPLPFSRSFMLVISRGIEKGKISVSRAAKIVGFTRDDLRALFLAHHVPVPSTM